jgi:hypothetical protein
VKTSKVSNPFGTYLKQFQEHLECQFYRPVTIADYDRCLTALNSKMAELSVSLEELYEDTAVNRTRLEMRSVWRNLSRSTLAARSNVTATPPTIASPGIASPRCGVSTQARRLSEFRSIQMRQR